jgi:3-deoxy-manno-octulosonate cytidylyltransferase (CMP-KDO synthetase)
MSLKTCIVIPARYDSKRFPGKPLHAVIGGKTLIERVWRIAAAVKGVAGVYIATDSERIADHVRGFGGISLMTPADVPSGTDRVHAALAQMSADIQAVVNLQGDVPLTPPWVVQALVDEISQADGPPIATPAVELTPDQVQALETAKLTAPSSGTTVVTDVSGHALYFSKYILPFRRDAYPAPVLRHIGLYAYRRDALARLIAIPPTMLEKAEGLEQLRALESGIPIKVVKVDYRGRTHHSIDHPNDVAIAEAILLREGEFEDQALNH